jgi:hypothetical protein
MTSPAVVILTEPERCDLADADALVEALLQVQRLGQAGMSVSQTLCDHPADAMKFIDAYAKAYPELQLQSSELPVPEQLYSMIADGRLSALQAPVSRPDAAKLDDAGRLQPLYVLSLGAPEILMQALQDNRLANNAIRLVEVAPVEDPNGERLSVAEAVSSRAVVSSSWNVEESAEFHADERALLPLEDVDSQPLKLDTVEPDLDHIVIDGEKDQFPAAPTLLDTGRAARAPADAGADRPVQSNAATASSETTSGDTSAAPAAVAAPVPEARDVARTETSPEQSSSPIVPDRDPKLSEQDLVSDDGQSEETPPPADERHRPKTRPPRPTASIRALTRLPMPGQPPTPPTRRPRTMAMPPSHPRLPRTRPGRTRGRTIPSAIPTTTSSTRRAVASLRIRMISHIRFRQTVPPASPVCTTTLACWSATTVSIWKRSAAAFLLPATRARTTSTRS